MTRFLQRYARKNGLAFAKDTKKGKGSHIEVTVGAHRTFVPSSAAEKTWLRIKRQLKIKE